MGRNRETQKINKKRKGEEEEPVMKKPKGCPCPGMKGCLIGTPVLPGEESVILLCSANPCPFSGTPIHKQCFEKYEDQLIKTLGEKGSARGWTEYKARRNLWRPCGQGLIVMHCRCLCEKGNVCPPEDVVLTERILVAHLDGDKKRKTKKKDLPIINMNGGANIKQARMQARLAREEMIEEDMNLGREFHTPPYTPRRTRNNSVTSFSSQSIISTSSNTRTAMSGPFVRDEEGTPSRGRGNHGRRGIRKEREESRARQDSGVSTGTPPASPVKEDIEHSPPLVPAIIPPPLTRSYAATIVSQTSKECVNEESLPISSTLSPISTCTSTSTILKKEEPKKLPVTSLPPYISSSADLPLPPPRKSSPSVLLPNGQLDRTKIPEWNSWTGRDFGFGELLMAGLIYPLKTEEKTEKTEKRNG